MEAQQEHTTATPADEAESIAIHDEPSDKTEEKEEEASPKEEAISSSSVAPEGTDLPATMRAVVYGSYTTDPHKLELTDRQRPRILKKNDVLVRVHATSINPIDWKIMSGKLSLVQFGKIFPFVPCFDVSGVVVDVGVNCKRIKKGDEVWAMSSISCGAAAEYIVLQEKVVALKPHSLSFTEAASLPLVGQTVYQSLVEVAKIKEGQKVLIHGSTGGCGSIAVQLAKHYKCEVTAICSERNIEFVRALGADHTVDYTKEKWWETLKGANFDVVYDTVSGQGVWTHAQQVLKKDGIFVTILPETEESLTVGRVIAVGASIVNRKFWSVFGFPKYHFLNVAPNWTDLFDLRKIIDESQGIRPVIERVYSLEEVPAAFEEHMNRKTRGKIVIQVIPDDNVQVPSPYFAAAMAQSSPSSSTSTSSSSTSEEHKPEEKTAEATEAAEATESVQVAETSQAEEAVEPAGEPANEETTEEDSASTSEAQEEAQ